MLTANEEFFIVAKGHKDECRSRSQKFTVIRCLPLRRRTTSISHQVREDERVSYGR